MERRKHQRTELSISVRVAAPGMDCRGAARDISTRGIFVELAHGRLPESAHDVTLHFEIDTGAQVLSRRLNGRIVRNEGDGLAVRFAEHDILGRAVVHELMYYMQLLMQESHSADSGTHDGACGQAGDRVA